ncbi:rod shape-determining protein MreC [Marinobacter vinifirmus]|uniref:Cell shape-determining protein MreC n=1 Tax=Marinobacter vinifirmus TaxID=355591 RepID=A0A558BG41_9GAMM|nr:rod shape-determining protein MreC [Marinobacter vinifirmus]TVT35478.1 MAG: rod shape-determining protein MreC [Marinobacter vinifirmus]
MFVQGPVPGFRLLLVILVSAALIAADGRFDKLAPVRSAIATGLGPVYWLGNAPYRFSDWFSGLFVSRDDLQQENEELKTRLLILERRALKYAALASENNELRRLLNSSEVLDDRVIVGEVVAVSPDPFSHEVVINKGSNDGVTTGQAVLDAEGLLGQVIQTSQFTSRVLLVSDSSHAVPVEVVRNGLRSILLGNGETDELELVHVPDTADIREGDMLVSSGLGGRFPRGYPVAEVSSISKESGEPFVDIVAVPKARLNQSRLVLVVFQQKDEPAEAPLVPLGEVEEQN